MTKDEFDICFGGSVLLDLHIESNPIDAYPKTILHYPRRCVKLCYITEESEKKTFRSISKPPKNLNN